MVKEKESTADALERWLFGKVGCWVKERARLSQNPDCQVVHEHLKRTVYWFSLIDSPPPVLPFLILAATHDIPSFDSQAVFPLHPPVGVANKDLYRHFDQSARLLSRFLEEMGFRSYKRRDFKCLMRALPQLNHDGGNSALSPLDCVRDADLLSYLEVVIPVLVERATDRRHLPAIEEQIRAAVAQIKGPQAKAYSVPIRDGLLTRLSQEEGLHDLARCYGEEALGFFRDYMAAMRGGYEGFMAYQALDGLGGKNDPLEATRQKILSVPNKPRKGIVSR